MNCWEFKNCDREVRTACPASLLDRGLDCWKLTGTMCNAGKQQLATREDKIKFCRSCDFYRKYANHY